MSTVLLHLAHDAQAVQTVTVLGVHALGASARVAVGVAAVAGALAPVVATRARLRRASLGELLAQVNEDRHRHDGSWLSPGFHAVAVHRFGQWQGALPAILRVPLGWLYFFLFILVRNTYGIEIPRQTRVGRRVRFSHQNGIVIHPGAVLGDDCVIRQNVTIGGVNPERWEEAPVLGRNVEVGAGAVIVGRLTIGDGARIGPNVVVTMNVPAGARVFVPPPRVIHQLPTERSSQAPDFGEARSAI
jgi:serine O-acetyltransferase